MAKSQYQHYLPQCYLKWFTSENTSPNREPSAFIFDYAKPEKSWHAKAPRNFGGIPNFYKFQQKDGSMSNDVEEYWGRLESRWPDLVKNMENPNFDYAEEDREMIAFFIGSLIARVPGEIERTRAFAEEVYMKTTEMLFKIYKAKPDLFEAEKKRALKKGGDFSNLQAEHLDISKFSVDVPMPFALGMNIAGIAQYAEYLMNMTWIRVHAGNDGCFITGDRPVSFNNVEYNGEPEGGGWDRLDALITVPITRKVALYIGWEEGKPINILRSQKFEVITFINLETYRRAQNLLVSPSIQFPGAAEINESLSTKFQSHIG